MDFKDYLKKKRKEAGITQKELAKRSGVSYSYLTKLEAGEQTNPTYEVLEALGKVLGGPLGAVYDFGSVTDQPALTNPIDRITAAVDKLNDTGRAKAAERVEELTEIPRYKRQGGSTGLASPPEGKDTSPPQNPAETK